MAPRSNLKQCIRLLTSRLESTSEFIALNLVMKDEVLETAAMLPWNRHVYYFFLSMLCSKKVLAFNPLPELKVFFCVCKWGKIRKTSVIGCS